MDEPFGALDSMTREQMQEFLVSVWERTGKQIFFITHSIEEALFLGTQVVVMSPRPGRIVARYHLDFVRAFVRHRDARSVKIAPAFSDLREEIRSIVHRTEPNRSAA
jgi:taurine transport system ATP-binding protein